MKTMIFGFLLLFSGTSQADNLLSTHDLNSDFSQNIAYGMHNISNATIGRVLTDGFGTELVTNEVFWENSTITYDYQTWQVRLSTVCTNISNDILKYSTCTVSAKSLFNQACIDFSDKKYTNNWKARRLKNMYCSASIKYKPTLATISKPKENLTNEKLVSLKSQCDELIFRTMSIDTDEELEKKADKICNQYRNYKAK